MVTFGSPDFLDQSIRNFQSLPYDRFSIFYFLWIESQNKLNIY